jgi:hypothetical protein
METFKDKTRSAPKALKFYRIVSDKDKLVSYLMELNILKDCMDCTLCGSKMNLVIWSDAMETSLLYYNMFYKKEFHIWGKFYLI